jgi:hypothetical protein
MNKLACTLLASLAMTTSALADMPVYRDQQLLLPEGVVVTDQGVTYYGDIRLTANADGSFTLVEATRRNPAYVDDVDVLILESFPVQLRAVVSGHKSVPCVELEEPAVIRDGNTFTIVLAETPLDPLILCAQVLAPFEVTVALDATGLEAGTYTVVANGVETTFTLAVDNF